MTLTVLNPCPERCGGSLVTDRENTYWHMQRLRCTLCGYAEDLPIKSRDRGPRPEDTENLTYAGSDPLCRNKVLTAKRAPRRFLFPCPECGSKNVTAGRYLNSSRGEDKGRYYKCEDCKYSLTANMETGEWR